MSRGARGETRARECACRRAHTSAVSVPKVVSEQAVCPYERRYVRLSRKRGGGITYRQTGGLSAALYHPEWYWRDDRRESDDEAVPVSYWYLNLWQSGLP